MALWWKLAVVAASGTLAAACTSDAADETTTTTRPLLTTTTTVAPTTTTTTTTSTTLPPLGNATFPSYSIVSRVAGASGDTVVVLLDESSYETLTDIDLHNVLADVVEQFPPIFEAHVVNTSAAAALVLVAQPDEAQQLVLADHYLARLEDGFRIVFLGPFAGAGTAILGS